MLLSEYPYVVVRMVCRLCKRSGTYRLARLAAKFGPEIDMAALMEEIAFDCPHRPTKRKPRKLEANCEARFLDIEDTNPLPPDLPPGLAKLRLVQKGEDDGERDLLRRPAVHPRR